MDRFVSTVTRLFEQRFGTNLTIQRRDDGSAQSQALLTSHWSEHFVYSRTHRRVSFPIFNSKRELQALAIAHPVENKDAVAFQEMSQFLQLTISEHFELSAENSRLDEQERVVRHSHRDTSKVIELRTRKVAPKVLEFRHHQPERKASLEPIWINKATQHLAAQIAFSVHDWIRNWAFINAAEIPDLIWSDETGWENLPQVTIFIPSMESLTEKQILTLERNLELMSLRPESSRPLILVASSGELSPKMLELQALFRVHTAKDTIAPRIQAHFLLFCQDHTLSWQHQSFETGDQIFYLPFSKSKETLH